MYLAMAPARWSAATAGLLFADPAFPFVDTAGGRVVAAASGVFHDIVRRRTKRDWRLDATVDVIDDRPFCRLIRFSRDRNHAVPQVLLVAPLSGHHATLLRGTVNALVAEHDVYVTDWVDASQISADAGFFDLDTYIGYVVDYIGRLGPDIHVIAVCQPAPVVLSAVALMAARGDPAQPRSMTLMGGPIDVRVTPSAVTRFAASRPLEWFARNVIATVPHGYPGAGRSVYPGFIQLGAFISMNPDRHVDAHVEIFNDLVRGDAESAERRRAFYEEYLAVMDLPAEYYLQTLDIVFQRFALPCGTMTWRGEPVRPDAIRSTALMTVEGELDDISAPGQTYAAHALCESIPSHRREHLVQPGAGHYGLFSGRRWRMEIMPRVASFIRAHAHGPDSAWTSFARLGNSSAKHAAETTPSRAKPSE